MSAGHPGPGLRGRSTECETLDRLLASVQRGHSHVLVVRGDAGVGKTALLSYLSASATNFRIVRASGVESEMELAFAGVHQLCAPLLGRLTRLPAPQRNAVGTAFGLSAGEAPDLFLVGLAVLGLLSDVAGDGPLLCLVDDAQWLDRASAQVLAFVARRLLAEPVAMVFAVRNTSEDDELRSLPVMVVEGLSDVDARALLDSATPGRLDERVRDRIVAEANGNPLALLELPKGLTAAELAGGFGRPDARPVANRIEQSFLRRVRALPVETQRLLLAAAAEPVGDVPLLWRAAEVLGISADAAVPAETEGLIELGARVRFRHPLARSAAYRAAAVRKRREIHRALAEVTDPSVDPDRRAWHRAQAALGPDETVAGELERSADRAQGRGGFAAAAAFLERATDLTPDPARRSARALAAAGTVHAESAEGAADATITVNARDWSKEQPGTITPIQQLTPDPPKNEHDLGEFSGGYENVSLTSYQAISEGPNAGLDFFKSYPVHLNLKVSYNEGALRTGSKFWRMQRDRRADLGGPCSRQDFSRTIQLAKRHEGFSFDDKNSHSEVILRVFVADTHKQYETAVKPSGGLDAVPAAQAALSHAEQESVRIVDDSNPGGKNPFRLGCDYNYNATVTYP